MRRRALLAVLLALLLVGTAAASAEKTRVMLAPSRLAPSVGRSWTAVIVVRGARPQAIRLTAASGTQRADATARRWDRNRYRARLVFPSVGRWTLVARIGRARFPLRAVRVQAGPPLLFAYPTEIGFDRSDALLLVENGLGRVARIEPASGRVSTFARISRPFGVAISSSGDVYVSDANTVRRIDAARLVTTVAQAESDVGPLAIDPPGNVYFSTATRIFRIEGAMGR